MASLLGDFATLPLALPLPASKSSAKAAPPSAVHWMYIAAHEPRRATSDTSRSLLAANVPIDSNEHNLRSLFANSLGGARIERVDFEPGDVVGGAPPSTRKPATLPSAENEKRGKKRKRNDVNDTLQAAESQLPYPPRDLQVLKSGSNAVLVFVDDASQQLAMKAVRKAASSARKGGGTVQWDNGGVPTGVARYDALHRARHPDPEELLSRVTDYLVAFQSIEAAQLKEQAKRGSVPDEDGFVTVTKGSRSGPARTEAAVQALEKQKKKAEDRIGDTFYRFQVREKAKEKERELRRQFQEDVRKVERLKERRKAKMPRQ